MILVTVAAVGHVMAQILVGAIGAAALYCACFLYEDEEGRLQNRIEQIWVKIDDNRREGQPFALVVRCAELLGNLLDDIFGKGVASVRLVGMSSSLALVVIFGALAIANIISEISVPYPLRLGMTLVFLLFVIGYAVKRPQSKIGTFLLLIPPLGYFISMAYTYQSEVEVLAIFCVMIISVSSDILFVAALRKTLRALIDSPSAARLGIACGIQIGIIIFVGLLPYVATDWSFIDYRLKLGVNGISVFNLSTVILSASFICLLLFLMAHKAGKKYFWKTLSHLFYPIARFKLITNRKALVAISIACFAVFSPPFAELLKKAAEWFK